LASNSGRNPTQKCDIGSKSQSRQNPKRKIGREIAFNFLFGHSTLIKIAQTSERNDDNDTITTKLAETKRNRTPILPLANWLLNNTRRRHALSDARRLWRKRKPLMLPRHKRRNKPLPANQLIAPFMSWAPQDTQGSARE
jgi:hypothetical protein